MNNHKLNQLNNQASWIFDMLAKSYARYDIPILMADHVPQRGGILSEFVNHGAKAYLAGGKDGQKFFENVPQFSLSYDTFNSRDESSIPSIVGCFPPEIVNERFATFCYTALGDMAWARNIEKRVNGTLVASNEQNLRSFFEEKTNLTDILTKSGLKDHIIPSVLIRDNHKISDIESKLIYEKLKDENGRIVIQRCGEGYQEKGGGKSTEIIDNLDAFKESISGDRQSYLKIAKFISGSNSNLSICAGNTISATNMFGATKGRLLSYESRFSAQTLDNLLERGKQLGINENNIVVNVQPGTLKVVGDPHLTSSTTNGVGNQLNYNFNSETMNTIYDIGNKLGTFMALCGKVGLCGLDLIITKEGHIYINELNDRQQGPTESAGLNNEANNLPSLHRESFIMNYANLNNREVQSYLNGMKENSKELYDSSAKISSPFYIKMHSVKNSFATQNIKAGNYSATQNQDESYSWNLQESHEISSLPEIKSTKGQFLVNINTVSAYKGNFIPEGNQLLRINGIATPETAPFTIDENGNSVLASSWVEPINSLYDEALTTDLNSIQDNSQNNSNETQSELNKELVSNISQNALENGSKENIFDNGLPQE